MFIINPYRFATTAAIDISFTDDAVSASDLTTYTFSAQSLGAEAADRRIIVGAASRADAARSISSVTVGGVSATLVVTANSTAAGAEIASIWIADVPSGTTGDVVVTFSAAMLRCGIAVWRMVGASSGTAHDTATDTTITASALSASIDCPAGGGVVGITKMAGSSGMVTSWTGITEDVDAQEESASNNYSAAHENFATLQTGLTVTATSGGTGFALGALAVASWGP